MIASLHGATVAQARRALTEHFRIAGIDSPGVDARVLIGHALGLDHAALAAGAAEHISDAAASQIDRFAARRIGGEPVARIVERKEFWGLPFTVTPAVLVPRPETETVVELALALLDRGGSRTRPLRIADLATGSGAIVLALLSELPNARGIGTDIDPDALAVAHANARQLQFAERALFVECNYGAALTGRFDLIVTNPPYVASREIPTLAREVREHDPHHALDGGVDGLAAYRRITADAPSLLATGGHLVVEIGAGQRQDVEFLLTKAGLEITDRKHDLSGTLRAIAARPVA